MWLPETAVDLKTLDIMAKLGIKFTILAPRQARRVRSLHRGDWHDVSGHHRYYGSSATNGGERIVESRRGPRPRSLNLCGF
jgi:hypothetical protein